jgi:hypothetical protein
MAHPASCTMGTGSFPGVKCGRDVLLTPHPFYRRGLGRVELSLSPPPPPGHNRACNGVILPLPLHKRGSNAGTGFKGYYRLRQMISTNLGQHRLTWYRSALPANPTFSRPRSWSLGNATSVVAERSGWRRVLGASKPWTSAKKAHPYRKRACLEALGLATTKFTQRKTGYPSWGHPTQLIISRESTGPLHKKWQLRLPVLGTKMDQTTWTTLDWTFLVKQNFLKCKLKKFHTRDCWYDFHTHENGQSV